MAHMTASSPSAAPLSAASPLIEAKTLHELLRPSTEQPALRVVDCRWSAKGPTSLERYGEAHIPSAAFVDLDQDLAQPGGPGRHPFPSPENFARLLARLGIGEEVRVVVYDDGPGAFAARFWFMLRAHGHAAASVLNGGLAAWRAAGFPVVSGNEAPTPVAARALRLDPRLIADRAYVRRLLLAPDLGASGGPLLLDARARARYRGDFEPLDKKAGHIPGAVNAPYEESLISAEDPRLKSPEELRRQFDALGAGHASEVVVSCGSGVTACHDALALELSGLPLPRLYVGSFSEWSSLPDETVATGPTPGKLMP